jgi:hypothetical protein
MPRLPKRQSRKNPATAIALMGLLLFAGGLLGVTAMVLGPGALAVVGLGVLMVFFIAFHYLLWGKWLSNRLPQDESE